MLIPYPTGVWNLKMTVFAISYSPYHPLCFLSLSSGRGNICSLRYEIVSCYTTPRTVKLTGPPLRICCELETWTEISPEESGRFLDYNFWGLGAGRRPWIKERQEDPASAPGKAVAHTLGGAQLLPSCLPESPDFCNSQDPLCS